MAPKTIERINRIAGGFRFWCAGWLSAFGAMAFTVGLLPAGFLFVGLALLAILAAT